MTILNPPGWIQALSTHTAAQLRTYLAALQAGGFPDNTSLRARGGVHPTIGTQFAVTQAGSPNMTVLVAAGAASIPGSLSSSQGNYFVVNDASVTLSISAAHATLARIDIVVVNVRDAQYSGADNDAQLQVITGTPASSPVAPTAPDNSITLAQVAVAALATTITTANITDTRRYMSAVGGVINATNEAARPTSSEIQAGQLVYSNSNSKLFLWNGTSYQQVSPGPLGVIARGNRQTDKTGVTSEAGVLRLDDISIKSGRLYRVYTNQMLVGAGSGDVIALRLRYTTDGSTPTTSSTVLRYVQIPEPAGTPTLTLSIGAFYAPGSDQTLSVLLTALRVAGTAANVTITGNADNPIELCIEDMGVDPTDTGTDV